jgi:molybdopterin-containing oxidoreductase family membrane subunit
MTKKLLCGAWGALFLIGAVGVFQRLAYGHHLTNYGSYIPWGLWVAAYIYFIGLSAGAFLLSSLVYVFNVKQLEPIGRLALVVATITLFMALLSIWVDLGHMERFWFVFARPNFHSMMAWMIWLYNAYFLLLLAEVFTVFQKKSPTQQKTMKILGSIGVPLAIAFHGGVGALFGVVGARVYWHSSMFPILFLTGALTSGGALLLAVVAWLWPTKNAQYQQLVALLSKITLGLLMFDVILEWAEISIPIWGGMAEHTASLKLILFGPFWWVFWILHLLLGVVIPIILLIKGMRNPKLAGLGGALIAVLFLTVRLNLVIPGQAVPILPGMEEATTHPRLLTTYVPSVHEWMIVSFVVALGFLMFAVAKKYFHLFSSAQEVSQ